MRALSHKQARLAEAEDEARRTAAERDEVVMRATQVRALGLWRSFRAGPAC